MCGIVGIVGEGWQQEQLFSMLESQNHRGPDANGTHINVSGKIALGHNRLSIIDLSDAGIQPLSDFSGRYKIVFNGEIYNYLELRSQLKNKYQFTTKTDTEVILAAFIHWGEACMSHFIGMFSFAIWDTKEQKLFAARDRFGVKPFYYASTPNALYFSSEIKALHQSGLNKAHNQKTWANFLTYGSYGMPDETFWDNVSQLPAGHQLVWKNNSFKISRWYDFVENINEKQTITSDNQLYDEYHALMEDSVKLRLRSDVPLGVNLSGGLDSSLLLTLIDSFGGDHSKIKAFTFTSGDPNYDELPWVKQIIDQTNHELIECRLQANEIPNLAASVQSFQDEPYGGIPTLAYAKLFDIAKESGVTVLLDGQGMDEQWAGYDYYAKKTNSVIQGVKTSPFRPNCLTDEFKALAEKPDYNTPFNDQLRNLQYRDLFYTKLPRAMRFNDRVSMRSSTELREPFLDHRMVELAFAQPIERKIQEGKGKYGLRKISEMLLPKSVNQAPKRPVQTPQREWLKKDLKPWVQDMISELSNGPVSSWFETKSLENESAKYFNEEIDNSFYIWQWISLSLIDQGSLEK